MNLFIEYFYFKHEERNREVFDTIEKNSKLNCIENIFAISDENTLNHLKNHLLNKQHKVTFVTHPERCSFQYLFDLSNNYKPLDGISCVANNDIVFTEDFLKLKDKMSDNDFYCISRYEYNRSFSRGVAKWSQDSWCWKNKCRMKNCNFYFGVPGNDNTIPYHAQEAGYIVKNPSLSFKSYHNHTCNIRPDQSFLESIRLDRNYYREVLPCEV